MQKRTLRPAGWRYQLSLYAFPVWCPLTCPGLQLSKLSRRRWLVWRLRSNQRRWKCRGMLLGKWSYSDGRIDWSFDRGCSRLRRWRSRELSIISDVLIEAIGDESLQMMSMEIWRENSVLLYAQWWAPALAAQPRHSPKSNISNSHDQR